MFMLFLVKKRLKKRFFRFRFSFFHSRREEGGRRGKERCELVKGEKWGGHQMRGGGNIYT